MIVAVWLLHSAGDCDHCYWQRSSDHRGLTQRGPRRQGKEFNPYNSGLIFDDQVGPAHTAAAAARA